MRHGYTLLFLAWGVILIVVALLNLLRRNAPSEAAPIAIMGLLGVALAAATWRFLDPKRRRPKQQPPPAPPADPPEFHPPAFIELRQSRASILSAAGYAAFFVFLGGWLVRYPDTLWTRWLAYPAAALMPFLAAAAVFTAFRRRRLLYIASAAGIEIRHGPASETVSWKDVATVKEVERRTVRTRSSPTTYWGRYLTFEDRAGEELLRLEDVAPAKAYTNLLRSVPVWTGLPVRFETTAGGVR